MWGLRHLFQAKNGQRKERAVRFRWFVPVIAGLVVLMLVACTQAQPEDMRLDLQTLQASTEQGVYQAAPVENARVGEVTEDLFVAVVVPEVVEEGQSVSVYLCDGEAFSQWLSAELDADGQALLGQVIGAQVSLRIEDNGEVFGLAQVPGQLPHPFRATEATGEAGLYRAEETFDGVDHVAGWIVLPDGRQKGIHCCGCIILCQPLCCMHR
jgi:hypothetical protein